MELSQVDDNIPPQWIRTTIQNLTPKNKRHAIVDGPFGSNLKTEHYRKKGIPIITSGFVTTGKFAAKEYTYVDIEKYRQEIRSAVKGGDIVMAKIGERCGASAILPVGHPDGILSGNALKITIDETLYSSELVAHILLRHYSSGRLDSLRTVGAQPAVSMANLKKYSIELPVRKNEQTAIATALSDTDALIAGLEKIIAKKRMIKQSLMYELLSRKTRLPGFTGRWIEVKIGDFASVTAGGTPSTSVKEYWGGNIRWMNSGELNFKMVKDVVGRITQQGYENSSTKAVPPRSVLIGLAGQGKTRGTVAMNLVEVCINQSIAAVIPNQTYSSDFLFYNLDNRYEELRLLSSGDGGRGGLNLKIIKSLKIFMPLDVREQTEIGNTLRDLDNELDELQRKLEKARRIKQAQTQVLLTGKIRLI